MHGQLFAAGIAEGVEELAALGFREKVGNPLVGEIDRGLDGDVAGVMAGTRESRRLSDLERPAAKFEDSAQISLRFRPLCPHKVLKLMKILARTSIFDAGRAKSDSLLGRDPSFLAIYGALRLKMGRGASHFQNGPEFGSIAF